MKLRTESETKVEQKLEGDAKSRLSLPADAANAIYAIPHFKHSFKYWQDFINDSFFKVKELSLQRCYNECDYTQSTLSGNRSTQHVNADFMQACKSGCYKDLEVFYQNALKVCF